MDTHSSWPGAAHRPSKVSVHMQTYADKNMYTYTHINTGIEYTVYTEKLALNFL